jgi:hypothetical protein
VDPEIHPAKRDIRTPSLGTQTISNGSPSGRTRTADDQRLTRLRRIEAVDLEGLMEGDWGYRLEEEEGRR